MRKAKQRNCLKCPPPITVKEYLIRVKKEYYFEHPLPLQWILVARQIIIPKRKAIKKRERKKGH